MEVKNENKNSTVNNSNMFEENNSNMFEENNSNECGKSDIDDKKFLQEKNGNECGKSAIYDKIFLQQKNNNECGKSAIYNEKFLQEKNNNEQRNSGIDYKKMFEEINSMEYTLDNIRDLDDKYFMNTFGKRTPVCFTKGKGMFLWDTNGKMYTDFLAGIAVSALGHSHPKLVNAISGQAKEYIHCSNLYYIKQQALLAKVLVQVSCADRVFFANSGAEANEGALKLARIYYKKKGKLDKYEVITLENSFHGRTLATIAATGQEKYQKPYSPLTPSFLKVPINNLDALEKAIKPTTCALFIEPIQGESGVNLTTPEYMQGVRKLCDEKDVLLMFDEVQCGLGRTGKLFGYEHFGVEPDIFTLAKALGGGFPIGALCAKQFVADAFEPHDHGSTFGGNPLACAAGLAVMEVMLTEDLPGNAAKMGQYITEKLNGLKQKHPVISEVRGKGLMIGIQFNEPIAPKIRDLCFNEGLLLGSVGDNILRMLPPLIIEKENADRLVEVLDGIIQGTGSGI